MLHMIRISILLILITSPAYARGGGASNNSHVTATSSRPAKPIAASPTIKKNTGTSSTKAGKLKSVQSKIGQQTKEAQEKYDAAKGAADKSITTGVSSQKSLGQTDNEIQKVQNGIAKEKMKEDVLNDAAKSKQETSTKSQQGLSGAADKL